MQPKLSKDDILYEMEAANNTKVNQKVVDCLYPIDADFATKRKTLEIVKVMKGAISVSKSRTGEVIYRHNKFENESLKRQLKRYDKARTHLIDSYDSRKRTTLRRWALVFEKQKSMNESIKEFDTVLTNVLDGFDHSRRPTRQSKSEGNGIGNLDDERDANDGKKDDEEQEEDVMGRRGIQRIRLNPIGVGKNSQIKVKTPSPEPIIEEIEAWPLENHKWVNDYIEGQRNKHEKLINKNILRRIQTGLTKGDPLFRFQLRAHLGDNPALSIDSILTSRSAKSAKTARVPSPIRETKPPATALALPTTDREHSNITPRFLTNEKDSFINYTKYSKVAKHNKPSTSQNKSSTLPPIPQPMRRSKTML